jgi:hypothetical protein
MLLYKAACKITPLYFLCEHGGENVLTKEIKAILLRNNK